MTLSIWTLSIIVMVALGVGFGCGVGVYACCEIERHAKRLKERRKS